MLNENTSEFVREHGEWTAMAIKLPDGSYTREPAPDYRLKRLLQVAADVSKKPLDQCRVVDLACLEGHYAIEFGAHGATAIGTEGRAISVAKCDYVRDAMDLANVSFVQDDVRQFSVDRYGKFDIIICSGILYHLTAEDAWKLLRAMREACSGILLLDTFISLSGRESFAVDGHAVRGHHYFEHTADSDKQAKLWASLDNEQSFWFTMPSLMNLLIAAGFTSVCDVLVPEMAGNLKDRKTYLAVAGQPVQIRTSDPTDALTDVPLEEGDNPRMDASQVERSSVHNAAKRLLPQSIKDLIKPPLRMIGVLPPDPTPDFMKKRRRQGY